MHENDFPKYWTAGANTEPTVDGGVPEARNANWKSEYCFTRVEALAVGTRPTPHAGYRVVTLLGGRVGRILPTHDLRSTGRAPVDVRSDLILGIRRGFGGK